MNNRLRKSRKFLSLTQAEFGEKIGISGDDISMLEKGKRSMTARNVELVCKRFGVSETWLRTGEGEMFVQPDIFSLDEFLRANGADALDMAVLKAYFEMPPDLRHSVISYFKKYR